MIPKKIHYCWFGKNPKTDLIKKCLRSWKKYCPDYEIIEWNEDNFDVNCNSYVAEAYKEKKWAFVTDYVRLWIIYNNGGIYLDTDVEVVKVFDDLLEYPAFFGFEDKRSISTGLGFGAEKGNEIVKRMMEDYEEIHFINEDGSLDMLPCPVRNTKSIESYISESEMKGNILYMKGAVVFPPEYFCPLSADGSTMHKTKNTYSIHWFTATWLSYEEKIIHDYRVFRNKCEKFFGKKIGSYVARGIYLFFPKKRSILKKNS